MKDQESIQNGLEAYYKAIIISLAFLIAGWTLIMMGITVLMGPGFQVRFISVAAVLIGFIVAPFPMVMRLMAAGFSAMFKLPEYEVITTYADGRKTTDGGAESRATNFAIKCFLLGIVVAIGIVLTIIYLIILLIAYLATFIQAKPKPSFLKSAFLLYIIFTVAFLSIPIICFNARGAQVEAHAAAFIREHGAVYNAAENAERQRVTAYTVIPQGRSGRVIFTTRDPDNYEQRITNWISAGLEVIIIGKPIHYTGGSVSIPVEHEGISGTIGMEYLSLDPPNQ